MDWFIPVLVGQVVGVEGGVVGRVGVGQVQGHGRPQRPPRRGSGLRGRHVWGAVGLEATHQLLADGRRTAPLRLRGHGDMRVCGRNGHHGGH